MNRLLIAGLALAGLVSAAAAQNTPGTPLGTTGGTQGTGTGVTGTGTVGGTTGGTGTTGTVTGGGTVQTPGLYPGGVPGTVGGMTPVPYGSGYYPGTTTGYGSYPYGTTQYGTTSYYGSPYTGGMVQSGYTSGGVMYPQSGYGGLQGVYGSSYGGCGCGYSAVSYHQPVVYSMPVDTGCGKKRKRGLFR